KPGEPDRYPTTMKLYPLQVFLSVWLMAISLSPAQTAVQAWVQPYNGLGDQDDRPRALAVDGSGNVFVTGYSTGSSLGLEYATVAYSAAGVALWTNRYHGPGRNGDQANGVAVDGSGNV